MTTTAAHVTRQREAHHEALRSMVRYELKATGLEIWRKLRRIEARATRYTERLCNGPEISEAEQDRIEQEITKSVETVFGYVPQGFFINRDPRGWALKLQPGSVPYALHEDLGRYQILAPEIN